MKETNQKFTVIGAGAAGLGIVASLHMHGASVTLFNRSLERIEAIKQQGYFTVELPDQNQHHIKPERITTNLKEAVEDADILILAINSNAQTEVIQNSIRYIKPRAKIVLIPGHTGGAICLRRQMEEMNVNVIPTIVEFQALPFICRVISKDLAKIYEYKKSVPVSSLPKKEIKTVLDQLRPMLTNIVEAPSVLWTGFHNMTITFQPVICMFNMTRFNTEENFYFYRDGVNAYLGNLMEALDQERLKVGRALRIPDLIPASEWMRKTYLTKGNTIDDLIRNAEGYSKVLPPPHPEKRFIDEHIRTGLVPLEACATLCGINVPTVTGMIEVASRLMLQDYRATGRNAQMLGISNMTKDQFIAIYNEL